MVIILENLWLPRRINLTINGSKVAVANNKVVDVKVVNNTLVTIRYTSFIGTTKETSFTTVGDEIVEVSMPNYAKAVIVLVCIAWIYLWIVNNYSSYYSNAGIIFVISVMLYQRLGLKIQVKKQFLR